MPIKKATGRCGAIPVHEPHCSSFFRALNVGAAGCTSDERRRAAGGFPGAGVCATTSCCLEATASMDTCKTEYLY